MIFRTTERTVSRYGVYVETRRENKDTNSKDSPLTLSKPKPWKRIKCIFWDSFNLCVAKEEDRTLIAVLILNLYQCVRNSPNLK